MNPSPVVGTGLETTLTTMVGARLARAQDPAAATVNPIYDPFEMNPFFCVQSAADFFFDPMSRPRGFGPGAGVIKEAAVN